MAEAGSSEVGVVDRQTTHWRSAPSKSQPALLVAQIYVLIQSCAKSEGVGMFYFLSIEHPFLPFKSGGRIEPRGPSL